MKCQFQAPWYDFNISRERYNERKLVPRNLRSRSNKRGFSVYLSQIMMLLSRSALRNQDTLLATAVQATSFYDSFINYLEKIESVSVNSYVVLFKGPKTLATFRSKLPYFN